MKKLLPIILMLMSPFALSLEVYTLEFCVVHHDSSDELCGVPNTQGVRVQTGSRSTAKECAIFREEMRFMVEKDLGTCLDGSLDCGPSGNKMVIIRNCTNG